MSQFRVFCALSFFPLLTGVLAQTPQFNEPVTVPVSYSFSGLYRSVISDFNRDGAPDILLSQVNAPDLIIVPGGKDRSYRLGIHVATLGACGPIAVADFDGDEVPDIVTNCVTQTSSFLLVFRGQGDFTFTESARIPLSGASAWIVAADFNGDGRADLAVAQTKAIALFFGNGNGTFQPATGVAVPYTLTALRVADFNGDGKPDLALTYNYDSTLTVLLNNGAGGFRDPINTQAPSSIRGLTVADFDGDGKPDVAVCGGSPDTVTILSGDGTGAFPSSNSIKLGRNYDPTSILAADLDGDRLPDLVVGHYYSGMVRILRNQGGGKMAISAMDIVGDMFDLAVADLDCDGKMDLVIPSHSGENVALFYGNGDTTFQPVRFLGSQLTLSFAGDFDADGKSDAAVLNFLGGCLHLLRKGTELAGVLCVDAGMPYTAVMADFNRDGYPDFAISSGPLSWDSETDPPGWLTVFLGNGDFTFRSTGPAKFEPWAQTMLGGDVNGDGIPDLISANDQSIRVSLGKGDGTFEATFDGYPRRVRPVAVADADRDGKADLVIMDRSDSDSGGYSNYPSYTLSILLSRGDGTFSLSQKVQSDAYGSYPVVIADWNRDGIPDIVAGAMENIQVFLGVGDGTFTTGASTARPRPERQSTYLFAAADVDGDGIPDLILPNVSCNCAHLIFGKPDGTFSDPATVPAGNMPVSVAAADFDDDAKTDLLFANVLGGTVTILTTKATEPVTPSSSRVFAPTTPPAPAPKWTNWPALAPPNRSR